MESRRFFAPLFFLLSTATKHPHRLHNARGISRSSLSHRLFFAGFVFALLVILLCFGTASASSPAYAYIANYGSPTGGGNTVSVIDTSTQTVVNTITVTTSPYGVAVNPDGSKVYVSGFGSYAVSVIDTSTSVVSTIPAPRVEWGVAISPDGSKAYVTETALANIPDNVSVIDTSTNSIVATIGVGIFPTGIALTPDGSKVYVANAGIYPNPSTVSVIDTSTDTVTDTINVGVDPAGVAVSPDGSKVYVANWPGTVSVINTATNTVVNTISVGGNAYGVAVSPDGSRLYVSINGGVVAVIDTSSNSIITNVLVGGNPKGISVTPDGSEVYVANYGSDTVSVIDTATNLKITDITVGSYPVSVGQFISPGYSHISVPTVTSISPSSGSTSGGTSVTITGTGFAGATDVYFGTADVPSASFVSNTGTQIVVNSPAGVTGTVDVTVRTSAGTSTTSASDKFTYTASGSAPIAAFSGLPTSGTAPLTVAFADFSSGSPTGWAWFFGDEKYTQPWTEQNASAGWPKRDASGSVAMPDGSIVLMGGYYGTGYMYNDTWRSTDRGIIWGLMNSSSGWSERDYPSTLSMPDGSIVLIGGSGFTGNNDTWRSTDNGTTWTQMTSHAPWTGRSTESVAMPDGSIVIMGGQDDSGNRNDTWRSTDNGATWTLQTAHAAWTERFGQSAVAMPDGSIVLMGGVDLSGRRNDTWRSTDDGATWTEVNASSGWSVRGYQRSDAMPDGSILLMGGTSATGKNNDIWRSTDNGATWTLVSVSAGWPARSSFSSVAMPDGSIVLMTGLDSTGNQLNDTWRFQPAGSSLQSPSHTYSSMGIFNVSLTARNSVGFNTRIQSNYIKVSDVLANFTWTCNATVPYRVDFHDATTTSFPPIESYWWAFGDGATDLPDDANPMHTYASAIPVRVNLSVWDSLGGGGVENDNFRMVTPCGAGPGLPTAAFSGSPQTGTVPLDVTFTDSSDVVAGTMWNWSFGDTTWFNVTTGSGPAHTYTLPGTYDVSLTVTNASGSNTTTHAGYIDAYPPLISATSSRGIGPVGTVFLFSGTNTYGTSPDTYTDIFVANTTDGTGPLGNGVRPDDLSVHTLTGDNTTVNQSFVYPGGAWSYPWDSTAISGGSLLPGSPYTFYFANRTYNRSTLPTTGPDFGWTRIQVGIEGPITAGYAKSTSAGTVPLTVVFTDISTGYPERVNLSFGDGSWSNSTGSMTHVYTGTGTFTPVIFADNSISSDTKTNGTIVISSGGPVPHAHFTASPTSGTVPLTVQFTDTSDMISPLSWNWNFGDGSWFNTTDIAFRNPVHTYNHIGLFTISLTITNASGSNTVSYPYLISVTNPGSNGGGGGGSDDSGNPVVTATATPAITTAAPATVAPTATSANNNDLVHPMVVTGVYHIGFPGLTFNADGKNTLILDLNAAHAAGAVVTSYFDRIEVYQHNSPGVLITFWGDQFNTTSQTITGTVSHAEFTTDPLNATFPLGTVSGSVHAALPALNQPGLLTKTLTSPVNAATTSRFSDITAGSSLNMNAVAYTLTVKKENLTTGAANVTLTVPASWVNINGGKDAVYIPRIGDDGKEELLSTSYTGTGPTGTLIFRGDSPHGTSLFGLLTAEATAAKQEEHPNVTINALSKPAMVTNVGMFEWLFQTLSANPLLILVVIAVLVGTLYFGWWKRRL